LPVTCRGSIVLFWGTANLFSGCESQCET